MKKYLVELNEHQLRALTMMTDLVKSDRELWCKALPSITDKKDANRAIVKLKNPIIKTSYA